MKLPLPIGADLGRAALVLSAAAMAMSIAQPHNVLAAGPDIVLAAVSCKQAASCEEAVRMWCGGYRRADGDGDGIPCEKVCHSLEQVQKIREEIGC
jgi:hypothetical protein